MRETREYHLDIGDVELAVVEWLGVGDPVLLLHATGYHSRCWNQVVAQLPDSTSMPQTCAITAEAAAWGM